MALVGTIAANLSAGTAQFEAGMNKAKGILKSFAGDFKSIGNIAAGFTLANIVAKAASSFTGLVTNTVSAIDAQAKLSDQLGISTEALAGLQLAGDLAGLSAEEMGANLGRLEKNIGKAVDGGGELAESFKDLKLDAVELSALPLDESLQKIAVAIMQVERPTERARLATELFGKSGLKMVSVLGDMAASSTTAKEGAEKLGVAISRADAKRIEEMNDSFTRLGAIAKGVATSAILVFADTITSANKSMIEFSTGGSHSVKVLQDIESSASKMAKLSAIRIEVDIKSVDKWIADSKTALTTYQKIADEVVRISEELRKTGDLTPARDAALGERLAKAREEFEKTMPQVQFEKDLKLRQDAVGLTPDRAKLLELAASQKLGQAEFDRLNALIDQTQQMENQAKAAENIRKKIEEVQQETKAPIEQFNIRMEELKQLVAEGLDPAVFSKAAEEAINKLREATAFEESGTAAKLKGSQAAFAAIDQATRRGENQRDVKSLVQLAKDQKQILQAQADKIGKAVAAQFGIQGI